MLKIESVLVNMFVVSICSFSFLTSAEISLSIWFVFLGQFKVQEKIRGSHQPGDLNILP